LKVESKPWPLLCESDVITITEPHTASYTDLLGWIFCEFVDKIMLKSSKTNFFKFENGNHDEFFADVYNIGELKHIR